MKKVFFAAFVLFSSLCFAIPNIKLYEDTRFAYQISGNTIYDDSGAPLFEIRDGSLYDVENNEYAGTISEKNDIVVIDRYYDGKKTTHSEYSKRTGFLLLRQTGLFVSEYDEKTGLEKKTSYYEDGQLGFYELYEYEKDRRTKTTYYKADGSFNGLRQCSYNEKTGSKIKESYFAADKHLAETIEYDSATGNRTKKSEYNVNSSLRRQTLYDKERGTSIERLVFSASSKKPEKWTFLQFDDNGNYTLSDDFYLHSDLFWFLGEIEKYAKESASSPIDWNENYSAIVRKYDLNKNTSGYSYIEDLKNRRYLSELPFTLHNKNSNFLYYFYTHDNEIDISSCYEIELIKKAKDYPAMNKSGKGSGPFGFDIGMTYEEVKAACGGSEPEPIADSRYYVKPKKAHPLFEKYIVWISDAVGLYYIKGISRDIQTSDYGTEAKQLFSNLLSPLERKYGKCTLADTIKPDYHWKDDKNWMMALRDGARTYEAKWTVSRENYSDFDGLFGIYLGINSASYSTTYIWIEYAFQNYGDAQDALDDVL